MKQMISLLCIGISLHAMLLREKESLLQFAQISDDETSRIERMDAEKKVRSISDNEFIAYLDKNNCSHCLSKGLFCGIPDCPLGMFVVCFIHLSVIVFAA